MNTQALIAELTCTTQPATEQDILAFEKIIGTTLPEQYRQFLAICNGGRIGDPFSSGLWFDDQTSVKFIGGLREDAGYSLTHHYAIFQDIPSPRISLDLIWIMTGEFGNHICLGVQGKHRGKVFFWDHEQEPDTWDGSVENSPNVFMLAETFSKFVGNLVTLSTLEAQKATALSNAFSWERIAYFPDGRKFITDKKVILDTAYFNLEKEPIERISHQQIERLFNLETTAEFGLTDLERVAPSGHFRTPGKVLLNRQYVQLLQALPAQDRIRFRASQPYESILIVDGIQIIGVIMPMKTNEDTTAR